MKVRIKETGEIIDVKPHGTMGLQCAAYETSDGRIIPSFIFESEKQIDWEERRYELAKSAMQGILCAIKINAFENFHYEIDIPEQVLCGISIEIADEMIEQLKDKNKFSKVK